MTKDIKYSGYATNPSGYESPDGQLDVSLNLLSEEGHIIPLPQTHGVNIGVPPGNTVAYIHKPSQKRHYITIDGGVPKWIDEADPSRTAKVLADLGDVEIYQVNSVGNTLMLLTSEGVHYFLWKGNSKGYKHLGTQMPECVISFGLQAEMKRTDEFDITFPQPTYYGDLYPEFSDEIQENVTPQILAKVNKFIAEESTSKGKFIFPFLVRYAYRLYDESLTMHSAPVLMVCSSDLTPRAFWHNIHSRTIVHPDFNRAVQMYESATLRVAAPVHSLDYACHSSSSLFSDWSDIIKSVDVFVSAPIYTYDQNGKCKNIVQILTDGAENMGFVAEDSDTSISSFSVCKHINQAVSEEDYPLRYQYNEFGKMYAFTFTPEDVTQRPGGRVDIPKRSADAVKEDIRSCSVFYFLHSIRIDDLKSARTLIPVKEDYLQSLVNREVMTDDYDSHDKLIATQSFAYNSRINLSGLKKILFQGFDADSLFNFSNGYVNHFSDENLQPTYVDTRQNVSILVYIKQDGRDIVVSSPPGIKGYLAPLLYLFFPNPNAYKAVVTINSYKKIVLPLEQHNTLNGAFYFGGWEECEEETDETLPSASSTKDRTIELPNKIYTSEVNNPFLFPARNINTIGVGKILGISTAAKALSQGQFGQFPLYAFTDEGVWALEVSSTGTYTARQPITRDVCTNPDGITQIDSAVLFPTSRGIMLISGSQTRCITDTINSETPFDALSLPGMAKLHSLLGHSDDTCLPTQPFSQFLNGCGMLYDYAHQRIIVYNKRFSYAYVHSLKSGEWGMMVSTIEAGVNSYPDALAIDHGGLLVNFSSSPIRTALKGLFLTRPIKLEAPDVLKTIDTLIQRGNFAKGHVSTVLYGSRDLANWHLVWTSADHYLRGFRGTPYKYFRIAAVTDLAEDESIFGATIQFTPRLTNRLR